MYVYYFLESRLACFPCPAVGRPRLASSLLGALEEAQERVEEPARGLGLARPDPTDPDAARIDCEEAPPEPARHLLGSEGALALAALAEVVPRVGLRE